MLQSRRATEAPSDLTVFDRQVAWIKWQQQQDNTNYERGCVIDNSNETHGCQGNIWPQLAMGSYPMLSSPRLEGGECSPLSKKRKVGVNRTEENSRMKKAKTDGEAVVELKRETNQTSNEKGESESSGEENSKVSAPPPQQKTDYIHVRARRGQATDSHSLAERVRREKISERMKYLQDLVPGCNKITGKAGMLDEIINYVQSLQRQVEFLSMKLAAAHPRLDFSIDQLITKEINQACGASFPTVAMSSETGDPSYLQFNLMGDAAASCGLEPAMNPSELELRRTASMLTPVPDVAVDSSFNAHGTSFAWDNDMMNLYNVEFHQGRGFSFPFQLFQGSMVPNNAKMEF